MTKTLYLGGRRLEYTIERKRVKNLNLRISPDKGIYVSVRRGVTEAEIERFILSKSDFILKTLDGFEKRERAVPEKTEDGKTVLLSGKRLTVRLKKGDDTVALSENEIVVFAKGPENEEAKRKILERFFKEYCTQKILPICEEIFEKSRIPGEKFPEIKFRKMRSRWGSCQPKKRIITFSTALAFVPADCVYYVVAHEFSHLKIPNHSAAFYDEVAKFVPEWKTLRKKLSNYPIT